MPLLDPSPCIEILNETPRRLSRTRTHHPGPSTIGLRPSAKGPPEASGDEADLGFRCREPHEADRTTTGGLSPGGEADHDRSM